MKFSLLCPTRERVPGLIRLIQSLISTTRHWRSVELIIMRDEDDQPTGAYLDYLMDTPMPFDIKFCMRPRSEFLNRDYYNLMAAQASGDFVWAVGDDVVFLTKGWDEILTREIDKYKAGRLIDILYVGVEDSTPPPPGCVNPPAFCCFPLVSKQAVETLGFFLHPTLPTWGADWTLHSIYSDPKINRILNIPSVMVDHISHHNGKANRDALNLDVERRCKLAPGEFNRIIQFQIPKDVEKLVQYIADKEGKN